MPTTPAQENVSHVPPEKRDVILDALREKPTYSFAARKARINRRTLNRWRNADPDFNAACIAARNEGLDALEDELVNRGMKNDTTAAIFMLKSLRREIYGDKVQHSGDEDAPLVVQIQRITRDAS